MGFFRDLLHVLARPLWYEPDEPEWMARQAGRKAHRDNRHVFWFTLVETGCPYCGLDFHMPGSLTIEAWLEGQVDDQGLLLEISGSPIALPEHDPEVQCSKCGSLIPAAPMDGE